MIRQDFPIIKYLLEYGSHSWKAGIPLEGHWDCSNLYPVGKISCSF